jgi:hypothetical protein
MARQLRGLNDDQCWGRWRADIERIKLDAYELFKARRTFREIVELFRGNQRLRATGGHVWNFILISYASFVVMRIRRETDSQGNTVSMTRLLMDIAQKPTVVTRDRYMQMLAIDPASLLADVNRQYFTDVWAGGRAADNVIDVAAVERDRIALDQATARVQAVGDRSVAHRQRVDVAELRFAELDEAFDALEQTIGKYYTLLRGATIMDFEPAPQFDTLEAFTFPWVVPPAER